jgi:heat shock protein HslJ
MGLRCCFPRGLLAGAVAGVLLSGFVHAQSASEFPFGSDLRMDARPMKGSKRVPFLQVENNGAATIDLWCNSVQSQFVVAADTVTILIGQKTERTCSPEQAQADDALLDALQQTTNWKREGDGVVLIGQQQLRFRPSTN